METLQSTVDTVNELSKNIQNLGVGIVSTAIILMLFIIGFIVFMKIVSKMFKKMMEICTQIFDLFMDKNRRENIRNSQDILGGSVKLMEEAKNHLRYACGIAHSDRSAAYVFHNGVKTLGESHLLKFSCLVEYSNVAQYCDGSRHMETPIGAINEACVAFLENGRFEIWDIDLVEEDSAVKEWMKSRNIKAAAACAVYNNNGCVIGFVVNEYVKFSPPANSEETVRSATKDLANRLTPAMVLGVL